MTTPSFLIVGAGSMGLVNGYYLQLGGADVTFLVRPGKKAASAPPALLYCYDDGELKSFDGYRVEDDVAALAGRHFDYAIVTLDFALCVSEEGTALLAALGRLFAETQTVVVIGGVGIGLREHYVHTTGLPEGRILNGCLGLLSHQPEADLPLHAPTDPAALGRSRMAFRHLRGISLVLDDMWPQTAQALADIYDRSGKSGCAIIGRAQLAVMTNSAFPVLAAAEIAGWVSMKELTGHEELWSLSCEARREVASLEEFGMDEETIARTMSNEALAEAQIETEQLCLPLDYQAFNRFHHGGKVSAQDLEVMRNCARAGARQDRPMTALNRIIDQLERIRAAAKQPAAALD